MKKISMILQILVFQFIVFFMTAQEVEFEYDNAGNRILRTIVWEEKENEPEITSDAKIYKHDELSEDDLEKYTAKIGKQEINIYPNPTKGTFKVELKGWKGKFNALIQLHSQKGDLVIEEQIENPITNLDIVNQPNGTYIFTIIINGKKEIWKIIKK